MRWPVLRRTAFPAVLSALFLTAGIAGGCSSTDSGDLQLATYALSACSQQGSVPTPSTVRIVVRGPVRSEECPNPDEPCVLELASATGDWGGEVAVGGIREGDEREVTILGYSGSATGDPVVFARATDVRIRRGESTPVETIVTRFAGLSCPAVQDATFAHRALPSVTTTADGKIIVAGGFLSSSGSGDDAVLDGADRGIYSYDPVQGKLEFLDDMRRGRGGHAAVFVPNLGEAGWLVFMGGADELPYTPGSSPVPIRFGEDDVDVALDDYEIFDIASKKRLKTECPACCTPDGTVRADRPAGVCDGIDGDYCRDECYVEDGCFACCEADGSAKEGRDEAQCAAANVVCDPFSCAPPCDQDPLSRTMVAGRLMAKPMLMSDGFVIVTGGGDFPLHDISTYRAADVFDPNGNCGTGGFQEGAVLPRMESVRSGHGVAFVETTSAGRYRYLLWGGTRQVLDSEASRYPVAETYAESSLQAKGISGTFSAVEITGDTPPNLFFHSLTPLGDRKFLVTGGVRRNRDDAFHAPKGEELYRLTMKGDETLTIDVDKLDGGIGSGRFMHSALSHDGHNVLLFGGFGDLAGTVLGEPRAYDDGSKKVVGLSSSTEPLSRALHGSLVLKDDTVLMVGGLGVAADLDGSSGLFEVYTPSFLNPVAQ